jgi:hypothetical protein
VASSACGNVGPKPFWPISPVVGAARAHRRLVERRPHVVQVRGDRVRCVPRHEPGGWREAGPRDGLVIVPDREPGVAERHDRGAVLEADAHRLAAVVRGRDRVADAGDAQPLAGRRTVLVLDRAQRTSDVAMPPLVGDHAGAIRRLAAADQRVAGRGQRRRRRMLADVPLALAQQSIEAAGQRRALGLERPLGPLIDHQQDDQARLGPRPGRVDGRRRWPAGARPRGSDRAEDRQRAHQASAPYRSLPTMCHPPCGSSHRHDGSVSGAAPTGIC